MKCAPSFWLALCPAQPLQALALPLPLTPQTSSAPLWLTCVCLLAQQVVREVLHASYKERKMELPQEIHRAFLMR